MLAIAALLSGLAAPAAAWNSHPRLTTLALRDLPSLDASVRPESLDDYLEAAGLKGGRKAFLARLKLNPKTTFPYRIGEDSASTVSLRAVVAGYADEPDWGMDQDLFDDYPELWRDEYRFMMSKKGFHSRAFRHMHWPNGFFRPPKPPGRVPVHDPTPLGVAPDRAKLLFEEAAAAFKRGRPYWGARFLSWSLHYLQDLTQPFHAVQLPSGVLLRFKPGGTLDVEKTARTIAYYHLAVDALPAHAASGGLGKEVRERAGRALGGKKALGDFPGARALCVRAAKTAALQAPSLSRSALEFLPEPDDGALQDPLGAVRSPEFWEQVREAARDRPEEAEAAAQGLEARVREAGVLTRTWVLEGLRAVPKPPAPRSLPEGVSKVVRAHLRTIRSRLEALPLP